MPSYNCLSVNEGWQNMYLLAQLGLCRVVQVGQWHHPLITHKDPTHSIVSWWPLLHNTCHDLIFPSITNGKRMAPHKTSKTERVVNYKHATSQVRNTNIEAWTVTRIYNDIFVWSEQQQSHGFPFPSCSFHNTSYVLVLQTQYLCYSAGNIMLLSG